MTPAELERLAAVEADLVATKERLEGVEQYLAGDAGPVLERDHQAMKQRIRARGVRRSLGGLE